MSFKATMPISLSGFDDPRTPLASPSKSRKLATRDQSGVGFVAPRCLALGIALWDDFAAWALPSASRAAAP